MRFKPCEGPLGVFAPASPFDPQRFEIGSAVLQTRFPLKLHPQLLEQQGFLAGSDSVRLAAIDALLDDPAVSGLIAARGGYGVTRLLPHLDWSRFARAQKPIVGFSDLTALHLGLHHHLGLQSIHGPVVTQFADLGQDALDSLALALQNAPQIYAADGPVVAAGRAQGPLVGGCLSLVAALVGTPLLDWPTPPILALEDIGEAPYRIDRMLTQLRAAHLFKRVAGVVLGDFIRCEPKPGEPTALQVLTERLGDLGIPVLAGLPFGHGTRNLAWIHGAPAVLDTTAGTLSVAS